MISYLEYTIFDMGILSIKLNILFDAIWNENVETDAKLICAYNISYFIKNHPSITKSKTCRPNIFYITGFEQMGNSVLISFFVVLIDPIYTQYSYQVHLFSIFQYYFSNYMVVKCILNESVRIKLGNILLLQKDCKAD